MTERKIIHIDMDAFYASVKQRDDPHLRGKPVVVAWRGNRSVVCAASYEARKFGVRSAMPAVRAERLCPNAVFLPPDFTRYRAVSSQVSEIFKRHTDLIEPLSLDEAYPDVSENKTGLPTATQVARTIRAQIRSDLSLTASAGVAPNKFLAKIASDWKKPDGLFVIQPEEMDSFLLPLPVDRPLLPQIYSEVLVVFVVVRDHLHRRRPSHISHIGAHDGSTSGIKEVYDCPVPAHFLDAQAIPRLRNPGTNELCNAVAQHDAEPAERDARPEALRRDASPEKGTRIQVTALS
jgi:hypothetical protein